jgi:hypothetical protein
VWDFLSGATRENARKNPATPLAAIAIKHHEFRPLVAASPETPRHVLAELAHDSDENVRIAIAHNPTTPPNVLAELVCDKNPAVQNNLAQNPATPPDIIAQLAGDRDPFIREAVAKNPAASPQIFTLLARDADLGVRDAVVESPSIPPEILAGLAGDLWRYRELAEDWGYYKLAEELSGNPATPPDVLAELARKVLLKEKQVDELRREWHPKNNLSQDPSTPAYVRARLARELPLLEKRIINLKLWRDWSLKRRIASNPSTPPDVLAEFARDSSGDYSVRNAVAANRSAPSKALAALACDPEVIVRSKVARNLATPRDLLAVLAGDSWPFIRQTVALHPLTPPNVLAELAYDPAKIVRICAAANQNAILEDLPQSQWALLCGRIFRLLMKFSKNRRKDEQAARCAEQQRRPKKAWLAEGAEEKREAKEAARRALAEMLQNEPAIEHNPDTPAEEVLPELTPLRVTTLFGVLSDAWPSIASETKQKLVIIANSPHILGYKSSLLWIILVLSLTLVGSFILGNENLRYYILWAELTVALVLIAYSVTATPFLGPSDYATMWRNLRTRQHTVFKDNSYIMFLGSPRMRIKCLLILLFYMFVILILLIYK